MVYTLSFVFTHNFRSHRIFSINLTYLNDMAISGEKVISPSMKSKATIVAPTADPLTGEGNLHLKHLTIHCELKANGRLTTATMMSSRAYASSGYIMSPHTCAL
ncbi:hypothetical protein ABVK25_006050 [Lepraria finkii]|uniref:Uncharacterized protein n=1 Tax=Lepraria finkii TaxID=1340010 RepID=A0ABR4B804_9LECA